MKRILLFLFFAVACANKQDLMIDREPHEFRGKVTVGMMAIGGETTGIVLDSTDGKTYELYMKNTGQLKKYADKKVLLKGRMTSTVGVEILNRRIIEVTEIREEN